MLVGTLFGIQLKATCCWAFRCWVPPTRRADINSCTGSSTGPGDLGPFRRGAWKLLRVHDVWCAGLRLAAPPADAGPSTSRAAGGEVHFLKLLCVGRAPMCQVVWSVEHDAGRARARYSPRVLFAGWATYLAGSLACSVPLPGCKLLSFCCPGLGIAVNLHLWQVRDWRQDKLGHHVRSDTDRSPASERHSCVSRCTRQPCTAAMAGPASCRGPKGSNPTDIAEVSAGVTGAASGIGSRLRTGHWRVSLHHAHSIYYGAVSGAAYHLHRGPQRDDLHVSILIHNGVALA